MMAFDFTAEDVLRLACEIEKNGAAFYTNAAASISDEKGKTLLTKLAAMEVEHEKTFIGMLNELEGLEKARTVFDPEDEALLYLKALADIRVFFDKPIDTGSMEKILKAAIQAEKDSIVLYLGMKELVGKKFGKERLEQIVKEEMNHIVLLSGELKALSK